MDSLRRISTLFLFSSLFLFHCRAEHAFNWGFGPNFVQTSFAQCSSHAIELIPLNSSTTDVGVPPYYMMAFAPQGTTIVSSLGDDPSQLSWEVQHPANSSLLLTVVDSIGQTGGFSSQFFDVVAGDNSCQPPTPSNPAVVTPNVTSGINTCEPWGLTITGGVKPYNISLAAISSPVVTNVTMGPNDDVFTFIDRADPGMQILAAVVDATGQWGISSVAVSTKGSSDTSCVGLISTSQTKAAIQSEAAAAASADAAAAKGRATAIALGVVFGLVVPLALVAAAFWWWRRKKQARQRPRPYDAGTEERARERPSLNVDTNVVRVDTQLRRSPSWMVDPQLDPIRRTDSPSSIDMTIADLRPSTVPTPFLTSPDVQSSVLMIGSPMSQLPQSANVSMIRSPMSQMPQSAVSMVPGPSYQRGPLAPVEAVTPNSTSPAATLSPQQRLRKHQEALAEAQAARARLGSGASSTSSIRAGPSSRPLVHRSQTEIARTVSRAYSAQPFPRRAGSSLRLPPVSAIPEGGPDIIIQHRDGGIVEELPPPYPAATGYPRTPRAPATPPPPIADPPPSTSPS